MSKLFLPNAKHHSLALSPYSLPEPDTASAVQETLCSTTKTHITQCRVMSTKPSVRQSEAISRVDKELLGEHVEDTENHQMPQRSHLPVDVLSETHTFSTSINHNNHHALAVSLVRITAQYFKQRLTKYVSATII